MKLTSSAGHGDGVGLFPAFIRGEMAHTPSLFDEVFLNVSFLTLNIPKLIAVRE